MYMYWQNSDFGIIGKMLKPGFLEIILALIRHLLGEKYQCHHSHCGPA